MPNDDGPQIAFIQIRQPMMSDEDFEKVIELARKAEDFFVKEAGREKFDMVMGIMTIALLAGSQIGGMSINEEGIKSSLELLHKKTSDIAWDAFKRKQKVTGNKELDKLMGEFVQTMMADLGVLPFKPGDIVDVIDGSGNVISAGKKVEKIISDTCMLDDGGRVAFDRLQKSSSQ